MSPRAGGIIIFANNNNKIHCLCGITKNNKISDLGGKINKYENIKTCAIREFHEETSGLYIKNLTQFKKKFNKNKLNLIKLDNQYYSFILKGNYNISITEQYNILYKTHARDNKKIGFYELKELKWFSLEYLYDLILNDKKKLYNRFYRILLILKKFYKQ